MRRYFIPAVLGAVGVAACLGPSDDPPASAYREPRGSPREFHGMPNEAQRRHLYSAEFPRLHPDELKLLRRINAEVNRNLTYLSDRQNYGLADHPVTEPPVRRPLHARLPPARYGDCEDFALTKKHRLDRAGFSASRSFVATARVPERFRHTLHCVLAVPAGQDWWILDNWHNHLDRAGSLERWWGWTFIRPRYDIYLLSSRTPQPAQPPPDATTAPGFTSPGGR